MNILRETEFGVQVIDLLQQHLDSMASLSPPESVHALDVSGLKNDAVSFWCAWVEGMESELMGCAALKQLDALTAEIKSMKTATTYLRKGVAAGLLEHLLDESKFVATPACTLKRVRQRISWQQENCMSGMGLWLANHLQTMSPTRTVCL